MKKTLTFFAFLIIFIGINLNVQAQLSGVKFIPAQYSTIASAITALNSNGVGPFSGVIFNVAAGHTETSSNLVIAITTNPPTTLRQVIFRKAGTGANPLIIADPGTSASLDGIIKLSGADYITFDGIDLKDPVSNTGNARMEWGYALLRASPTDGCQHNVIKNCTITLQKINTLSRGIFIRDRNLAGLDITATNLAGQNSYNKFYGNTISNVYKGIIANSSSLARDINNEIGVNGLAANSISNWGGGTDEAEGIRCEGQVNVKINNNIINGGLSTTNTVAGILAANFGATGNAPNYEISYNQVTVNGGSREYGIWADATADTLLLHDNTINCYGSGIFFGIVHDPISSSNVANIYKNRISIINNTSYSSNAECLAASAKTIKIYNNFISCDVNYFRSTIGINCKSSTASSTVGIYYNSIYLTGFGDIFNNFFSYGVLAPGSATATTAALDMRNNIIMNLSEGSFIVAYRRNNANLQNYALTSDYNIFHAGTPSANRLIYWDGTNADQTLPPYQARVAPRDANSKSVLVNFQNPAVGDLHLRGTSIGDPNLKGTPVPGITTDIDGQPRSATSPYIGADEVVSTLNLTINLQACSPSRDTVTVLLRETVSPYAVVDSARGVIDATGSITLFFANAVGGASYYIVVKHRNSIETWSKVGGQIFSSEGVLNYNFTSSASQAFGNNQTLVNGKWSIYTGDVNQDGIVDASDLSSVDNDAFIGAIGYLNTDLNCDEFVDATDLSFADNNALTSVQLMRP